MSLNSIPSLPALLAKLNVIKQNKVVDFSNHCEVAYPGHEGRLHYSNHCGLNLLLILHYTPYPGEDSRSTQTVEDLVLGC